MAGFQLQMTRKTSLLLKKRKNGPRLGFKNIGNTCYLIVVLQFLTYTLPLANFCLRLQQSEKCMCSSSTYSHTHTRTLSKLFQFVNINFPNSIGEFLAQRDKKNDCPFCLLEKRIVRTHSIDSSLDTPDKIIRGLKVFPEF
uniref:Peptidase C19 ubiquitin carboxyl-terminal hydrolase domain-containing protein n=1 Tax=Lactuca sativa TaxID=4236 RepID=A0A9R1URA1_LACSA|nr:hypothetical protein LSAT_V11C800452050 [Lactuca sativa]